MVSRFDRYLSRQVLVSTVFAVVLLSLVLVLGSIFQEIRSLLVEQGAPLGILLEFVVLVLPFSLVYTIPWGFLAAVLLVFGRLSADQELVAIRGAGRSLFRIAMPVFAMGVVLSGACFYLNGYLGPRAKDAQRNLLFRVLKDDPLSLLEPGVVQSQLKGQKIFIESKEGNVLRGFHAYQLSSGQRDAVPVGYVYADRVDLVNDEEAQQLKLRLENAYGEAYEANGQVRHLFTGEAEPWLADYSGAGSKKRKPNAMENPELLSRLRGEKEELTAPLREQLGFELARRSSFSLAPLALAAIAIPLGITSRRRETSSGLLVSVGIAFGYFLLMIIADEARGSGEFLPLALLWLPNVLCLGLATFLILRSARKA